MTNSEFIFLVIDVVLISYFLWTWNYPNVDPWREPFFLIIGVPLLLFSLTRLTYYISFQNEIISTKQRNLLIFSAFIALTGVIFTIIKRNYVGKNRWRLPFGFSIGILVFSSCLFNLITLYKSIFYAYISLIVIGGLLLGFGVFISKQKSKVKWLKITCLIFGIIFVILGLIGLVL